MLVSAKSVSEFSTMYLLSAFENIIFISWRTSSSSTAGREARIYDGTLPAVGWSDLLALLVFRPYLFSPNGLPSLEVANRTL